MRSPILLYETSSDDLSCLDKLRRIPSNIASMICGPRKELDDDLGENLRVKEYHFPNIFYNDKFKKLRLAGLALSAIFSILAVAFYFTYGVILLKNSNIWCIGKLRIASIGLGFASGALIIIGAVALRLYYWIGKAASLERAICIIFVLFFISFIFHVAPGVIMHAISTHMLASSPNNIFYHCEAENSPMVAYSILFSPDSCSSSQPNQICEFRSVANLCEFDLQSFKTYYQLIRINGTLGACHCKSPSPEGLQVCRNYFHEFEIYPSLGILFSCLSAIIYGLTCVGICLQDKPDAYNRLIGCCVQYGCTCCETLKPLIAGKPHVHESTINI